MTVITVSLNKNQNNKPKLGLIKKLSANGRVVDSNKCQIAAAKRASLLKEKKELAANQSKKVSEVHQKAITTADEVRKEMLVKQTAAATKAQSNRNAMTQAKINKAAMESRKLEIAKSKASTEEAKAAKAKAEKQAASAAIINVSVGSYPDKKIKKDLVNRLTPEKLNRRHSAIDRSLVKAANLRHEMNQIKIDKATPKKNRTQSSRVDTVIFNTKAKIDKARSNKQRILGDKVKKAAKVSKGVASVRTKITYKNDQMKASLREKLERAECNNITALERVVFKGAVESRKVLQAKQNAQTAQAKAAKAKANARAGTEKIINVELNKSPNKAKPNWNLINRLSLTPNYTGEYFQSEQHKAFKNRVTATHAKMAKAAKESTKVETAKVKSISDEAKAAKAKAQSRPGEYRIINVPVAKNQNIKPKAELVSRLSKK